MSAKTGSPAFDARLEKFKPLPWQVQAITQSFEMTAAPFALMLDGRPVVIGDQVQLERIAATWEAFRVLACIRDDLSELGRCQDMQRVLELLRELVAGGLVASTRALAAVDAVDAKSADGAVH